MKCCHSQNISIAN